MNTSKVDCNVMIYICLCKSTIHISYISHTHFHTHTFFLYRSLYVCVRVGFTCSQSCREQGIAFARERQCHYEFQLLESKAEM